MRRPLATGWCVAALHVLFCAAASRPELAASAAVSWMAFLFALRDQPEAWPRPPAGQRAAAFALCAAALSGAAALGLSDASDRDWRVRGAGLGVLSAARLAPLIFGAGLLLWRSSLRQLRARSPVLLALACPLFTPVPAWLRQRLDPSRVSAWGAQQLLALTGLHPGREGALLVRPGWSLLVASECSGLGAVLQLFALVLLLAVVTRAPRVRIALLLPLALAIGLFVNFARLSVLCLVLERGEVARFDYWHEGTGSLLYSGISAALLLLVALPLTLAAPAPARPVAAQPA